jgi:DNA-binding response OmpR family regulator
MSPVALTLPDGSDALRILVAAGDRLSLDYTAQTLEQNGFTVMRAVDDASALKTWQSDGPDVVLVDVDLPNEGGFELCRNIRQNSRTPVIMVANDAVESDVIRCFACGADDFVVRPFGSHQLAWRIRAILGRYASISTPSPTANPTVDDLTLDLDQHEIVRGFTRAQLTPTEFRIFRDLAANEGATVSVSRLIARSKPTLTIQRKRKLQPTLAWYEPRGANANEADRSTPVPVGPHQPSDTVG